MPPWEPIADWIARNFDKDNDELPEPGTEMSREMYEQPAKALAYDIALYSYTEPGGR